MIVVIMAIFVCTGIAFAECPCKKAPKGNFTAKTVNTVTETTQSAVTGTATVAETTVKDTVQTPKTAIQAAKDTANTALNGADKVVKSLGGE
jgi:hypothetical protein